MTERSATCLNCGHPIVRVKWSRIWLQSTSGDIRCRLDGSGIAFPDSDPEAPPGVKGSAAGVEEERPDR